WYKLIDKTYYGAILSIFGAVITLILNIYLIPKISFVGSAWATLICYFLMMAISFYLGQQKFKIKYNIYSICSYFLVAFVLFFASIISGEKAYMNIQIDNTIFFGLYIIFMYTQVKKIIIKKNNFY
ncbi:MAG: polysaccharide biosynthesis protein, partial [Flavobacteriales bacterium]|nr:polysaccharide biosynthesis protein [Flavobacteriales bacterium]